MLQSIINSNQLITNVFKKTFGFARRDSMTGVFMYLSLPTIVYNARVLFVNQCSVSCSLVGLSSGLLILMCSFLTFPCILYFNYGLRLN